MPVKSGLPPAVRGIAGADVCAYIAGAIVRATARSENGIRFCMASSLALVLVVLIRGENHAAIRISDFRSESVVGPILGFESVDGDHRTDLDRALHDAAPHQLAGSASRKGIVGDFAVF